MSTTLRPSSTDLPVGYQLHTRRCPRLSARAWRPWGLSLRAISRTASWQAALADDSGAHNRTRTLATDGARQPRRARKRTSPTRPVADTFLIPASPQCPHIAALPQNGAPIAIHTDSGNGAYVQVTGLLATADLLTV